MDSNYKELPGSIDLFEQHYDNLKKLEAQITQNIQIKTKRLQQNENIFAVDKEMRQQIQDFKKKLDQMQNLVKDLNQGQITSQEIQRRRNIATELLNRYTQINSKMMENEVKNKYQNTLFQDRKVTDNTQSTKNTMELQQMQRDVYGRQEEQVDNLINTVDRIGNHSKVIGRALDEDKVIMSKLTNKVTYQINILDGQDQYRHEGSRNQVDQFSSTNIKLLSMDNHYD